MALPQPLEHFRKRPGMYVSPVEFDVVAGFLQGLYVATGVLTGFREWLVVKLGYGNNLAWPGLALRLIFPDAESPEQKLQGGAQAQAQTVEKLFGLIEEFWQERGSVQGLRGIYVRHHQWLQRQDWYDPSSADWIAEEATEHAKQMTA